MKLMMVCPTCNGKGSWIGVDELGIGFKEKHKCGTCHGKAVVEPSAQILDDLECAEIERELVEKFYKIICNVYKDSTEVILMLTFYEGHEVTGKTKLEALRKAKDWMDGRGAE